MKNAYRAPIAVTLALALAGSTGCSSWQPLVASTPVSQLEGSRARFSAGNQTLEMEATGLSGPFVFGELKDSEGRRRQAVVDLRAVDKAEAKLPSPARKPIIIAGASAGALAVVGIVVGVIAFAAHPVNLH